MAPKIVPKRNKSLFGNLGLHFEILAHRSHAPNSFRARHTHADDHAFVLVVGGSGLFRVFVGVEELLAVLLDQVVAVEGLFVGSGRAGGSASQRRRGSYVRIGFRAQM